VTRRLSVVYRRLLSWQAIFIQPHRWGILATTTAGTLFSLRLYWVAYDDGFQTILAHIVSWNSTGVFGHVLVHKDRCIGASDSDKKLGSYVTTVLIFCGSTISRGKSRICKRPCFSLRSRAHVLPVVVEPYTSSSCHAPRRAAEFDQLSLSRTPLAFTHLHKRLICAAVIDSGRGTSALLCYIYFAAAL